MPNVDSSDIKDDSLTKTVSAKEGDYERFVDRFRDSLENKSLLYRYSFLNCNKMKPKHKNNLKRLHDNGSKINDDEK